MTLKSNAKAVEEEIEEAFQESEAVVREEIGKAKVFARDVLDEAIALLRRLAHTPHPHTATLVQAQEDAKVFLAKVEAKA